jgi:hypothetical protein
MGSIGSFKTSGSNHLTPRNNPEYRGFKNIPVVTVEPLITDTLINGHLQ